MVCLAIRFVLMYFAAKSRQMNVQMLLPILLVVSERHILNVYNYFVNKD